MDKLAKAILSHRKLVLATTLLVTLVLGWSLKDLKVDPDVFNYLPEDDRVALLFREVGAGYGGNYTGIIGLEAADVFTRSTLEDIRMITDSLRIIPGVATVTSLTHIIDIRGSDWGIEIGNLVDKYRIPDNPQELEALRQYTLSQDMYRGALVSDDATFTAILVKITEGVDKIEVAGKIRDAVAKMNLNEKVYFGGMPFALKSLADIILGDVFLLAPITALVIILVLYFSFRSWRGVVLPLLTVAISITWTIGLMGWLSVRISIISDVIPVILLAVGSAYTIHVLNRIRVTGAARGESMPSALAYIIVPVFLAAVTTMAGFVSFIFGSYLTLISTFGVFMAAGVLFAMILSLTFAPAFMAAFPQKGKPVQETSRPARDMLTKALERTAGTVTAHPRRMAATWTLVILASLAGIFLIERKVDIIGYFRPSDPTRVAEIIFREKFGGSMPVYVTVKGDVKDPANLEILQEVAGRMELSEYVSHTQSMADLIVQMNDVMGEGKSIPGDRAKVEQLWFLLEGQSILEQLVAYDEDEALVTATFNTGDVDEMEQFTADMEQFIASRPEWKDKVAFTGLPSLYLRIDRSLINSQMQSLVYAMLLVFLMVSAMLRSPRRGIQAIIPILTTLLVLFGFMGLAGIPLDIGTVLVGSVSIGIGVDYAIHMITQLDHEMKSGNDLQEATRMAIGNSGRAIVINVLAVALGFLVLSFSNLVPLQRFGLLVAVTMITSGAAAITLLPAVLNIIAKPRRG